MNYQKHQDELVLNCKALLDHKIYIFKIELRSDLEHKKNKIVSTFFKLI